MIRLLHTSDWHLGRLLYGKSLLDDQAFCLDELITLVRNEKPHALLIAGDVFDRPFPPEAAVTLFDQFLHTVIEILKTPVVLIPGNHDSCERLGFAARLLRDRSLTIFSRPEDAFTPLVLQGDDNATAYIYGIPFVEPPLIAEFLGKPEVRTPDQAIEALCSALMKEHPDPKIPAVLLCHAFVIGGEVSDSEKDIFIGGSAHVNAKHFDGFTYTALGHLHKPQRASADHIRYSGSLLPYSKSEAGHEKSITKICIRSDGENEITEHVLKRRRNLRYLESTLESLIREATADAACEDYIIAGFTDPSPVLDAFARLRNHYPNLLHVSRAGGYQPSELPAQSREQAKRKMSELELFATFFEESTNAVMNEAEREQLISALKELDHPETIGRA